MTGTDKTDKLAKVAILAGVGAIGVALGGLIGTAAYHNIVDPLKAIKDKAFLELMAGLVTEDPTLIEKLKKHPEFRGRDGNIGLSGLEDLPVGTVLPVYGSNDANASTLPEGWQYCENSPIGSLAGRFLMGSDSWEEVGQRGGYHWIDYSINNVTGSWKSNLGPAMTGLSVVDLDLKTLDPLTRINDANGNHRDDAGSVPYRLDISPPFIKVRFIVKVN